MSDLGGAVAGRKCLERYAQRLKSEGRHVEHLVKAVHGLFRAGEKEDPNLLGHGLELLAQHLGATQTCLVMTDGPTLDTRWWYPEAPDQIPPAPVVPFCLWLLEHPERVLAVQDTATNPHVGGKLPAGFPHGAVLGCALRQGSGVRALLFASFSEPRALLRTDTALIEAVGLLLSRFMEVEDLKQSILRLEDALAITQAVMEDSSIRDQETDLPNLRYLEVWEKAMLSSEHRPTSLVVAECQVPLRRDRNPARIRKASAGVRAGDLLLRLGSDRFMVVFQHTPHSIAHVLLLRLRTQLGAAAMGATLWIPGPEGLGLGSCRERLDAALAESRGMETPSLVWRLPEFEVPPVKVSTRRRPGPTAPTHPASKPWIPPILRQL